MSIVQIPYFPVGSITSAIVLATFVCNHKYNFTIATSIFGLFGKQSLGTQPKSMLNHYQYHHQLNQTMTEVKKASQWPIECISYLLQFRFVWNTIWQCLSYQRMEHGRVKIRTPDKVSKFHVPYNVVLKPNAGAHKNFTIDIDGYSCFSF